MEVIDKDKKSTHRIIIRDLRTKKSKVFSLITDLSLDQVFDILRKAVTRKRA